MSRKNQIFFCLLILLVAVCAKKFEEENKPDWAKKKITDYSDADMERLLDQWNVRNEIYWTN